MRDQIVVVLGPIKPDTTHLAYAIETVQALAMRTPDDFGDDIPFLLLFSHTNFLVLTLVQI